MKNDRLIDLGLTGYEELFMSTEERLDAKKPKVEAIPLAALTPFRNHPFKVKEDEEMAQLMRSIADAGVLSPALARPLPDGGYELISGHRRLAACKALGMDTMPVIVRDLTDEEAVITMVDSNLQREHILPSEKAFAYKMKMEALKHQGRTLGQVGPAVDSHRTSRKGKQAPRREAAAGHPQELRPAGCEQGERGHLLGYAVCRLHGAVAGDYPQLGGKDHLFLLHADGKGKDRTVFPKHRADAGRNSSQAHSELLSA